MNSFEQERPSLPAISLGTDIISNADNDHTNARDIYAKQIRTLGNEGDILLITTTTGMASNLLQAVSAAHDKHIQVIALTGRNGGDIATLLDAQDIELRVPVNAKHRIHEVHLLTLFCLCDLIDQQLFGGF
jgi:D-sedoheptulose 7-phosphate isomerase